MCAPMVNYMRQNYGTGTEELAFECDKKFCGAATNLYQQNTCMTSGIIFVTILYSTMYLLFTIAGIPYCVRLSVKYFWISHSISYSLV